MTMSTLLIYLNLNNPRIFRVNQLSNLFNMVEPHPVYHLSTGEFSSLIKISLNNITIKFILNVILLNNTIPLISLTTYDIIQLKHYPFKQHNSINIIKHHNYMIQLILLNNITI